MCDKAIVLELKEAYALAIKEGGEVVRIKRKNDLAVGDQIYILEEDLYYKEKTNRVISFPAARKMRDSFTRHGSNQKTLSRIAGMAAMIVLCISLFLLPQMTLTAYAQASFDGDACIQVEMDQNYRIIHAFSPDNSVSPEELTGLEGKYISEIRSELLRFYGTEDILIGYAFKSSNQDQGALRQELYGLFAGYNTIWLFGSTEDIQASAERNISLGKYIAGKELSNDAIDDVLEDLELAELLRILQADSKWLEIPEFKEALEDRLESILEDKDDHENDTDDDGIIGKSDTDNQEDDDYDDEHQDVRESEMPQNQPEFEKGSEAEDDFDNNPDVQSNSDTIIVDTDASEIAESDQNGVSDGSFEEEYDAETED